ncbi:MAG: AAA family ATPase [Candidatus Methanoperedens sp.]|nr:AAA family ATPase [Candidatus Methanoperedens sp.]
MSAPGRPSATIRFEVSNAEQEFEWHDQEKTHDALGHVSVFDTQCAAVYIREKTDVAFRPFGLDLFDKLSDACEAVRRALEKERRELLSCEVNLPDLPEGTTAHELVSSITSLTKQEEVEKLSTLSDAEKEELRDTHRQFYDLQAEDSTKAARALTLRSNRLDTLSSNLMKLDAILTNNAVKSLFEARDSMVKALRMADDLQTKTFPPSLLNGTGSSMWRELWEAARRFSTDDAYPNGQFPVTSDGARCVLCQQDLRHDTEERLKWFEEFIRSTIQQELSLAKESYQKQLGNLENLVIADQATQDILEELRIEKELLTESIEDGLEQLKSRREEVLRALRLGQPLPEALSNYELHAEKVGKEAQMLRHRADQLLRSNHQEIKKKLKVQLLELEARETLGKNRDVVLSEIERQKKLAAYGLCMKETNTHSITRKSTELTKRTVTQQLVKSFKNELDKLQFTHLEVELQPVGGSRGTLFHKLILKRASSVNLPSVVSEGEARTLSIAAFFAEMSTASDKSAIMFDDPVSSLDHEWREKVAHRLAEEANVRQVIVFTHDIVFLIALAKYAEDVSAPCQHQYLRRDALGTGVSSPELPWVAMKVKDRIGALKNMWQSAEKLYRTSGREEYDYKAFYIYSRLREAWERGIEEILLGGVVERYRQSIQTQRAKHLTDITEEDCKTLESGMTKCSRWTGHDQAPAENVSVPNPDELSQDIEALEDWVNTISKRRK